MEHKVLLRCTECERLARVYTEKPAGKYHCLYCGKRSQEIQGEEVLRALMDVEKFTELKESVKSEYLHNGWTNSPRLQWRKNLQKGSISLPL